MSRDDVSERIRRVAEGGETALDLGGAGLREVPGEVWRLTGLKSLNLGGNELKRVPPEIGNLKSLADLDMSGNKLAALPAEVGRLTKLTLLDLSDNALASLPEEFGRLKELMALWLGGNRLAEVPHALAGLSELRLLGLERNRLTELRAEMRGLKKLLALRLEGNALPVPPEILKREGEPEAILNYYFAQRGREERPLNEAKLLFVGHASAGKTSLVGALLGHEFNPQEEATRGVAIARWQLAAGDGEEVRLRIWDFGGQEIMHATHQFFLTRRSLYVLVVDARAGEEEGRVEYWLKIIQSFGKDSPVVVVGNKTDEERFEVNRGRLQTKYPNIRAFVETSCRTGRGIEELRSTIEREVAALGHVRDALPANWLAVKEQLEAADGRRLSHQEFVRVCRAKQIRDELSQTTLKGFLHDLGAVLSFREGTRREADIFNTEWVTNGVYSILHSPLLAEARGLLERGALASVLDAREYPPETHASLLDMMRKFELCFDCGGDMERGERSLVPELLTREEPQTGDWSGALVFHYHYNVLPLSVVSRFIVRTHRSVWRGALWRTGVVLTSEEGNRAHVEADMEDRKIVVQVDGPDATRRAFLDFVRSHFESIHRTLPGIVAVEDAPPHALPETGVDYKRLLLDLKQVTERVPERLEAVVNLKWLLDGIETARARKERFKVGAHEEKPPAANAASTNHAHAASPVTPSPATPVEDEAATPDAPHVEETADAAALAQLARIKESLDAASRRFARWCLFAYLSALALVGLALASLTYGFGWDTMEPWTYFIGGVATLGAYAYFAVTQQEFSPSAIYQQLAERKRLQAYRAAGFDPETYERLTKR